MTVSFSINLYDKDGDSFKDCILLYIGEGQKQKTILCFDNLEELKQFADDIKETIIPEIKESYENDDF